MRIRELIFQNVLGEHSPVRLQPDGNYAKIAMPAGVAVRQVQDLIMACLFPADLSAEKQAELGMGEQSKLALSLETRAGELRVIRRADASSVRLQRKRTDGYVDLATGASQVQQFLKTKLRLPAAHLLLPLHFWEFDPGRVPLRPEGAEFGDDPRIPELVAMYLTSLEVESVEDQLKELEIQISEGQKALGQGVELEEKLQRGREKLREIQVDELSETELELVEQKEEKLEEFREQLNRLRDEEETEQRQVRANLPELPYRKPLFLVGAAVALCGFGASLLFHEELRSFSLLAIPGLGVMAYLLLQYFDQMNRASVHQVRLSSIRRRIDQVIGEEILFLERLDHMMVLVNVKDEAELRIRIPMAAQMRRVIEKIEEQLEAVRANAEYRRARKDLSMIEEELRELRARRAALPDFVMNSFQLENDLQGLGVNLLEVRKKSTEKTTSDAPRSNVPTEPFAWLAQVAEETGQWEDGGLDETAQAMWSKICSHVLSDRFAEVNLRDEGRLEVGILTAEQLELWQRTRPSEVRALQVALALALHMNHYRIAGGQALASIWVGDLQASLTPVHIDKFESVFKSAAKTSQLVFLERK